MNTYKEKQQLRREKLLNAANQVQQKATAAMERSRALVAGIEPGQPVLVGHHSEARHRGALNRSWNSLGRSVALTEKAEDLRGRAERVGTGGISSDDPEAVAKLKAQLHERQQLQERMKLANKAIRQNAGNQEAQKAALLSVQGVTEQEADDLLQGSYRRLGYPSYRLTNNNAEIRRLGQRLKELEQAANRESLEIQGAGYVYREDVDDNRAGFTFPVKPGLEVRNALKSEGFRFSPTRNNAWVRQLTPAAMSAARRVRGELERLQLE